MCLQYKSLKTLRKKEKLLVTSNFSFSHNVFYPFKELSSTLIMSEIVVCKLFQFGRVINLSSGKGLNNSLNLRKISNSRGLTYSLPKYKILDWSKLKGFADEKINVDSKIEIWFEKARKHCGIRRKCWLPVFSPFPTMFSRVSCFRVVKRRDCVAKS